MEHLSFQTFIYEGFDISGLFCAKTNRLYYTKAMSKRAYKKLKSGTATLQEISGAYLSIEGCKYVGECEDLKLKFEAE